MNHVMNVRLVGTKAHTAGKQDGARGEMFGVQYSGRFVGTVYLHNFMR